MKKVLTIALTSALAFILVACGSKEKVVTGEAEGYGGKITATVTVSGDKITKLEIDAPDETPGIGAEAVQPMIDAIVKAGTTEGVDMVSGATWTSKGIIAAVENAMGATDGSDENSGDDSTISGTGLKAGLGIVSTPRLGPGKDDKDIPVYSFNEVAAYVVVDDEGKIVDLEVDIMEIITPNHDDAEDNYIAGWPGQSYSADMDGDGTAETELLETEEDFVSTISAWKTKRDKGSAYKMNSGTWEGEMDIFEEFFKGKTVEEIKEFVATSCSDLNGRPLINPTKDEDVEKRSKLTDEQKAELDSISGATMSLNDAHGDIIGAIEKAVENAKPVEDIDGAKVGLSIIGTPRLGPGKDDKDEPVYSFNVVVTGGLFKDGVIVDSESDIVEIITPNHDGAEDNALTFWPGQSYNNDADADGKVDGVWEMTDDEFVQAVNNFKSKRDLGSAYKMNSGTWTEEMDKFEEFFKGKTVEEIKEFVASSCSDLNGRPLINPSKDEDVEKRGKLTDEQKAELDSISGATMSLNDAHGDLISSIEKAAELAK
mgnify:FL=1